MKERKRSLRVFILCIVVCGIFAIISHLFTDKRNEFQQKSIPSPLLSYGETGKILRKLDAILPLEEKRSLTQFSQNTVDFAERAATERKKWLLLNDFKKYKDTGIFGYIEMKSSLLEIPFFLHSKTDGDWNININSRLRHTIDAYPFFIKENSEDVDIQLQFTNKQTAVKITGLAFFQKGYHPLIYTDPIAFNSFFRDGSLGKATINQYGVELPPASEDNHLLGRISFMKKNIAGISKHHKKQGNTQVTLVAKKHHPLLNQTRIDNSELAAISKRKIQVLAIDIEDSDLYSKDRGILTNFNGHGRKWERLSYTRLYREGKSVFSHFTGIRLQGGNPGRKKGLINFRLFFREEYGKSMLEGPKLFNGAAGNIKRLAVKQSEWPKWPLNSPIAYDVSRQLGVLAPATELVLLYVNGEEVGLYYIVPHLGEKQIKNMVSGDDFKYFRLRGTHHDTDLKFMAEDFLKILKTDETMSTELASEFFDIENLTRQIFSYILNATGDFCQGLALKSNSPGSKMFWYSWDMDHSYVDVPIDIKKSEQPHRERWEQSPDLSLALNETKPGQKRHYCGRVALLQRLINEDPAFRERTKHLFASMMNHQVTEKFITSLLDQYQQKLQAISYPEGDEYIEIVRDFFRNREDFIYEQMQHYFRTAPPVTCSISSNVYPIIVDGFLKSTPYTGKYFPGATLSLGSADSREIQFWQINGEKFHSNTVNINIESGQECEIQAIH